MKAIAAAVVGVVLLLYVGVIRDARLHLATRDVELTMRTPKLHLLTERIREVQPSPMGAITFEGRSADALPLLGDGGGSLLIAGKLPDALFADATEDQILDDFVKGMGKTISRKSLEAIDFDGYPGRELSFNGAMPMGGLSRVVWGRMRVILVEHTLVLAMIGATISTYQDDPDVIEMLDSLAWAGSGGGSSN